MAYGRLGLHLFVREFGVPVLDDVKCAHRLGQFRPDEALTIRSYIIGRRTKIGEAKKGDRVQFSAKVSRSEDDPSFGFISRPTKAKIILQGES